MIRNRAMTRPELDRVLDWAATEGWNPGLDDADAFWATDPGGFFVAEADGAPVAAISVVNHSDAFAFLGLYLCLPSHRDRGIGLGLWRHALVHAGDRTVGLDGVEAQQANYALSGFARASGTTRYIGRIDGGRTDGTRNARAEEVPALVAMEAAASGVAKPAYMTAWFAGAATRATFVVEGAGGLGGAATVRRCRNGAKVGPLIAPSVDIALSLLGAAGAWADTVLTLDVPGNATSFGAALDARGFAAGFRTARMYAGRPPRGAASGPALFGVGSLELG